MMSETETEAQGQKPKTSKLAIASLWLALASIFAFWCSMPAHESDYIQLIISFLSFFIFVIGVPLSFVLGVVSVVRIQISKGQLEGKRFGVAGTVISFLFACYFISVLPRMGSISPRMVCGTNLSALGRAIMLYSNEFNEQYPTPDKWCDLLLEYTDVSEKQFRCMGNKKDRCSYAMNPNAVGSTVPPDMVLLFESDSCWDRIDRDWNKVGGPELLNFTNHEGYGFNVLFCDGHVSFIHPRQLAELKWKPYKKNK